MINFTILILHLFAGFILFLGLQVLLSSNKPIHAIFYLVGCFLMVSVLLFYLNHEFFALIYMMVYIGAIAVLFLFVIMMLDIKQTAGQKLKTRFSSWWFLWVIIFCIIIFSLMSNKELWSISSDSRGWFATQDLYKTKTIIDADELRDIYLIGLWLFNAFPELCILIGSVLLISMIGAIILVSEDKVGYKEIKKYQQESLQLNRKLFESIELRSFIQKK